MFYSSLTFGFDEPQFLYFPNNGFASLLFWTKLHALKRHVLSQQFGKLNQLIILSNKFKKMQTGKDMKLLF